MEKTTKMLFISKEEVEELIRTSPDGPNTKFLNSAHSLWYRFKNYDKAPPMGLEVDGKVVSLIFATYNRDRYSNLYEIVTLQGAEGRGYASRVWDMFLSYAVKERNIERLKISCTPSSVSWHYRNGLIFWAVDPTGSLRSDQKLFATREEQLEYRQQAILNPSMALPTNPKVIEQLKREGLESYSWGQKKTTKTTEAIEKVGDAWLRDALFDTSTLESFL